MNMRYIKLGYYTSFQNNIDNNEHIVIIQIISVLTDKVPST